MSENTNISEVKIVITVDDTQLDKALEKANELKDILESISSK